MSVFKTILTGSEVELGVIATLKEWMPTYLRELELQLGRIENKIPPPIMYTQTTEIEDINFDQLPTALVVSPGLGGTPMADGEGTYRAPFVIGVAVICSAKDQETTKDLAKIYAAAVRAVLLQKRVPSLGGQVDWIDESYDDLPELDQRTMCAGYGLFSVWVDDLVTRVGGPLAPADPETQPGSVWPTADDVLIETEMLEGG